MTFARLTMCAERINAQFQNYSLLDAGCRTKDLQRLLTNCREYVGTDFVPGDGILQCDLEQPLPFRDREFDIVVALDVLEHLNNPHSALAELQRVAGKALFISLPNIFYIQFRYNFARGRGLSGKYAFPPVPIEDRHRWVLSYQEAVNFVYRNSRGVSTSHSMILPVRGRSRIISRPVERILARLMPNAFAYGALFEIRY